MKKIVTLVLALTMAIGMTTMAFAATGNTVTSKNDATLQLGVSSGSFEILSGQVSRTRNSDNNILPGTKFRVEIIHVTATDPTTGEHTGTPISKSAFARTGADAYFRASKGSRYFKTVEMKYTDNNTRSWAQVELRYPYLSLKEDDIEFRLGVKRGSQNDYYDYIDTLENDFIDNLGEDNTDATISNVGTRLKVDDSGFADIITIDFENDDQVIYDVKMFNKDEVLLFLDTDVNKEITTAFADVDIDYYMFNQVGTFSAVGTLSLPGNAGDHVYELVTGTPTDVYATFGEDQFLVPVDSAWNVDEEVLQFRTRNLGKYIVTNTALNLTEWENIPPETPEVPEVPEVPEIPEINEEIDRIPETGANGLVNVAAVAGAITLAAAGAVAFKKK